MAWAESWPTVFGIIAQKYYINELTNIATVGELYSLFPYDGSTTGRLIYNDSGHTDSQGNSTNMGITYELEAGQTVYIKVGLHYVYSGEYVMRVSEYPVIY